MIIEDIFSKQLTRDINGVVKAEQVDNDSVYVELDEYVITQEFIPLSLRRFLNVVWIKTRRIIDKYINAAPFQLSLLGKIDKFGHLQ